MIERSPARSRQGVPESAQAARRGSAGGADIDAKVAEWMGAQPERKPIDGGRVLIADDEDEFRRLMARRARQLGMSVVEASDGEEALRAVRQNPFDVLVLDYYLPARSGLEVFEAAREEDGDVQAIVVTGQASVETAVEAFRAGVFDFLTKPLDSLAVFDLSVKRALEHRYLLNENRRLFDEVERLAMTDALTGLYNRHKLEEALETEIERAWRYHRPLSIILIDLDDLKRFNDSFGHLAGDAVLKQVADVIRSQLRSVDIATRFGGDEFLIILPEAELKVASIVAERIYSQSENLSYQDVPVTFSMGVVEWGPKVASSKDFLRDVDQALYGAKQVGSGHIGVGDEVVSVGSGERGQRGNGTTG